VARSPIVQRGQVVAAIGLAVTDQPHWNEGQKAIVRLVGRSFSLLYERAAIDAGFPLGQTLSFDHVSKTRGPSFVKVYAQHTDVDSEVAKDVVAHATLPLLVDRRLRGLFNLPLFETRSWTAAERVLLITAELQSANEELEAFSYSASHDLRTPVRHIKGVRGAESAGAGSGRVGEGGSRLTGREPHAADRMYSMIDAMLALSRVCWAELKLRPVKLRALVEQARQDVQLEFPARAVTWQVARLPKVQADATVLQQVMTNLLSNAVKFAAAERPLSVRVWAEQRPLEVAVFVQDTGVDFNPEYGTRLFGAFQRLHNQREFSGTGIGLATVRRIMTRHGGKVWPEGRLNEGATFAFSLLR
jgi:signal transduction histidine kinase